MNSRLDDRALQAVRRVRSCRERDSRIGLQRALATQREREAEAETARQRLVAEPTFDTGAADAFRAHRLLVVALAETHADRLRLAASSTTVAAEAQRHWQRHRKGIRAVELLLDHRAAERRAERARREARELDDIAGQAWQRRQTPPSEGGRP